MVTDGFYVSYYLKNIFKTFDENCNFSYSHIAEYIKRDENNLDKATNRNQSGTAPSWKLSLTLQAFNLFLIEGPGL